MSNSPPTNFPPVDRALNVTPPPMDFLNSSIPCQRSGTPLLTPPTSPAESQTVAQSRHNRLSSLSRASRVDSGALTNAIHPLFAQSSLDTCLRCPFDVKILSDPHGGNQVFGSGAWSTVYKAVQQPTPNTVPMLTPPSSPVAHKPFLLAVKVPTRRDAGPVLEQEGEILTCLATLKLAEKFVVPFFGLIPRYSALVLAAIPLSLEDHITTCSARAKQSVSIWNMSDPVIGGSRTWLDLAHKVVTALHWLHDEAGIVHGDLKPGNFLLRPTLPVENSVSFPFEPIFIDFSSSHFLHGGKFNSNSLSAVTREYTAPELLSSAVLRDPRATTTCSSDVFSAAVTLLVTATGDTKVYSGSIFQRQAMATQGWQVIQLVRSGDQGSRLPRQGIVERVLERAVLRAGTGRVDTGQWLDIIKEMMVGEPSKAG